MEDQGGVLGGGPSGDAGGPAATSTVAPRARRRHVLRHLPFAGTHDLKVEPSGRIVLPSTFRGSFVDGGYLRYMPEKDVGYVALWTVHDYMAADRRRTRDRQRDLAGSGARRSTWRNANLVRIDSQGRIVVPEAMRLRAGIDVDATLLGNFDRIELWAPAEFEKVAEDGDGLFDMEAATFDDVDEDDLPDLAPPDELQ